MHDKLNVHQAVLDQLQKNAETAEREFRHRVADAVAYIQTINRKIATLKDELAEAQKNLREMQLDLPSTDVKEILG